MSAKAAMIELLRADHFIGVLVADRIRPFAAGQGEEMPYIIVTRNSSERNYDLSTDTGLIQEEYSVELYDRTVHGVETLRRTVEHCINGLVNYRQEAGPIPERVYLEAARIINIDEDVLVDIEASENRIYMITIDLETWSRDI